MSVNASFKICLHRTKETTFHRFQGSYTLAEFQSVVAHLWGGVSSEALGFDYQDQDGDMIRLSCAFEWEEALRLWSAEQQTVEEKVLRPMRVFVRRIKKKERKIAEKLKKLPGAGDLSSATEDETSPPVLPTVPKLSLPTGSPMLPPAAADGASSFEQQPPESSDPEMVSVLQLLSKLYECDAAQVLYAGNEGLFEGVVKRVADGEEVHLDVDRYALYQVAQRQGNAAIDRKAFAFGADLFRTALGTYKENNILEYNLACALALQEGSDMQDEAVAQLSLAVDHGYDNMRHMSRDPDLRSLHTLPAFQALCGGAVSNAASSNARSSQPSTIISPRLVRSVVKGRDPIVEEPATTKPPVVEEPEASVVAPSPPPPAVPTPSNEPSVPASPVRPLAPSVQSLLSVFPHLTVKQAEEALRRSAGNLQVAVNTLLSA